MLLIFFYLYLMLFIYLIIFRHRWTGRYEAHLWDNSCRREGQSRKGRQGTMLVKVVKHYLYLGTRALKFE